MKPNSRNTLSSSIIAGLVVATVPATAVAQDAGPLLELQNSENTMIELDAMSAVTIDPQTGNLRVTPLDPQACTGGNADCADVQVSLQSLTAPASVSQGQNLGVSWSSRGAWDCVGSLQEVETGDAITVTDWDDGAKPPSGSENIATEELEPANYRANLTCRNGPVEDSRFTDFTVTDPNPDAPAFCSEEGRVPPAGPDGNIVRDTAIIHASTSQTTNWLNTWQDEFPLGQKRDIAVDPDTYFAIAFDTTGVGSGTDVSVGFSEPQFGTNVAAGFRMLTVSECPGDFTPQADPNCRAHFSGGEFSFFVGQDEQFFCDIEQGKTYYLNVLYTDQSENDVPDSSPTRYFCTGHSAEDQDQQCGNVVVP